MIKKNYKIIRLFSRLNIGGPSYHVINLADQLTEYGFDTTLVIGQTSTWEGSLISYAERKNIKPYFINSFQAAISPLHDLLTFFELIRLFKKEKPLIVHTHTFKAGLIGRLAAFLCRTPLIVHTYHGHLLNNYWSGWKLWILKFIEQKLCLLTDACIGVSKQVSQDLVQAQIIPSEKMKTVTLGFDFSYLQEEIEAPATLRTRLNITENHFVFGTACRLVPIKNIQLLIHSSMDVLQEFPKSHLVIVGQGPEKNSLIALAQQLTQNDLKLLERIHFLDWIVPFQRELKSFDYYICCSQNEGTSVSVIEALISEVPVLSTAVGGMPDLLKNGEFGELIPSDSIQALTQSIKNFILQEELRKTDEYKSKLKKISREISNIYNEKTLARNTFEIYQKLMQKIGVPH